jgi:hypothetical protein
MYCTIAPAPDPSKMKPASNKKVDAYKARRTGTFKVEDDKTQMVHSNARCRSYFRANPPLLTRRPAELYGLLPYKSSDWGKALNRRRFVEYIFGMVRMKPAPKRLKKSAKLKLFS